MKIAYSVNEARRDIENALACTTTDELVAIYNRMFDDALSVEDGILVLEIEGTEES